jgi:hypothetical protein
VLPASATLRSFPLPVPDETTITIDGNPAAIEGGAVRVVGLPGETRQVELRQGARVALENVTIGERGLSPERLFWSPAPLESAPAASAQQRAPSVRRPAASAKGTSAAAAPAVTAEPAVKRATGRALTESLQEFDAPARAP